MCWKCGQEIKEESISRSDECPKCGTDLHSCKNCLYFSPGSHYDCHEDIDELVKDKEKRNFCDSFRVRRSFSSASSSPFLDKEEAKKAFDSLFQD